MTTFNKGKGKKGWLDFLIPMFGTAALLVPTTMERWKGLLTLTSPSFLALLFVIIGVALIFYQTAKGSEYRPRVLIAAYVMYSVMLMALISFAIHGGLTYFRSGPTIRHELVKGLLFTYQRRFQDADDCFALASKIASAGTRWSDAGAFIAVCKQEWAFSSGAFDSAGETFRQAVQLAGNAKQKHVLAAWLTLLKAEAISKSGDLASAEEVLKDLATRAPPEAALCSLDMLLAIINRRTHHIDDSRRFYLAALQLAQENRAFPWWKLDATANDPTAHNMIEYGMPSAQVILIVPYSEMLWECGDRGDRQEAIDVVSRWRTAVIYQPHLAFPLDLNLGVFQWRKREYSAAEKAFEDAESDLAKMGSRGFGLEEYDAFLYSNWAGLRCEEFESDHNPQTLQTANSLLLKASSRINVLKDHHFRIDPKVRFQTSSTSAILKSFLGEVHGALAEFEQTELEFRNFQGCDPSSVARFFEVYASTAKRQGFEHLKLLSAATYWWFQAGEPERAKAIGLKVM